MSQATNIPPELGVARERFLELVSEVRPELHRYCARITGSAVDGEDIVQEALARSFYAMSLATEIPPLRPFLFKVAHNTAIDFLRRYERKHVEATADIDETAGSETPMDPEVLRAALGSFLDLPILQRSAVILKDVLGHSLEEAADTMGTTAPAVKAALFRGRTALRASRAAEEETSGGPPMDRAVREKLERYVAMFNGRDWDGLRAMIGDECRLDLVAKAARRGKEIHGYFGRYQAEPEVRMAVGTVEGRPALLVFPKKDDPAPAYFVFLEWDGDRLVKIRDFRYVPYIAREAVVKGAVSSSPR